MLYHIQNISCHTDIVSDRRYCVIFMSSFNDGIGTHTHTHACMFVCQSCALQILQNFWMLTRYSPSKSNYDWKFQWKPFQPNRTMGFIFLLTDSANNQHQNISNSKMSMQSFNITTIDFLNSIVDHLRHETKNVPIFSENHQKVQTPEDFH